MPQDSCYIATKTDYINEEGECNVFVFNYSKCPSKPEGPVKPDCTLKGHTQEG